MYVTADDRSSGSPGAAIYLDYRMHHGRHGTPAVPYEGRQLEIAGRADPRLCAYA